MNAVGQFSRRSKETYEALEVHAVVGKYSLQKSRGRAVGGAESQKERGKFWWARHWLRKSPPNAKR